MSRYFPAALVVLLGVTASAQAADKGFYLGASVGQATTKDVTDDLDFDADDTGFKAFAGIRLLNNLGVEGGYVNFGKPSDDVDGVHIKSDSHAVDAFAIGFLPLATFDLFGKVGLVNWSSSFDISDLGFSDDSDGTDLAWGVGGQFRLGSAAIRAEWERFELGDHVDMFSVGVSWTFF
jgi:hypothetical protein